MGAPCKASTLFTAELCVSMNPAMHNFDIACAFRPHHQVDRDVMELRTKGFQRGTDDGRPEKVLYYNKYVSLQGFITEDEHLGKCHGLHDVVRFNLGHLKDRMDKPFVKHSIIDPEEGRVSVRARLYTVHTHRHITAFCLFPWFPCAVKCAMVE